MRRLKHYLKIVVWQTGLGYLLLWAVTFWALDEGATVFGKSGVCYPDEAKVLFYWVCDAASPLAILAGIAAIFLAITTFLSFLANECQGGAPFLPEVFVCFPAR